VFELQVDQDQLQIRIIEAQIVAVNIETGKVVDVLVRDERKRIFSSPVISPDEKLLAYMADDDPWRKCGYWRIISTVDHSEVHVVDVRPETTTASFSPDSQSFWLRSSLGLARFDLASGSFEPVSRESLSTPHCMTFSRDGTRLYEVTGAELRTWDLSSGTEAQPRRQFDTRFKETGYMRCIRLSDDGTRSVWAGRLGDSQIHSVINGQVVAGFYAGNMSPGKDFSLTPDLKRIVHDAYYGELRVCDLWTGKILHELMPKVRPRLGHRMALASDCRTLAVVTGAWNSGRRDEKGPIQIWDILTGKKTGEIPHEADRYTLMQFSGDSRMLRVADKHRLFDWNVDRRVLVRQARQKFLPRYWMPPVMRGRWHFRRESSDHLELIETETQHVARQWNSGKSNSSTLAVSNDHHTLAVKTNREPIVLYSLFEVRPDSLALQAQPVSKLVNDLSTANAMVAFDIMCELIRRHDDSVEPLAKKLSPPEPSQKRESSDRSIGQMPYRDVEVLYAIHSEQSRSILKQLASGDPLAPVTAAATAAIREWDHGD